MRDRTREALVPCVAHEAGAGFFTCQAWGDLAENLASSLTKGQRVIVIGQLRQGRFEANGQQRSAIEIFVQEAGPSLLWATAEVRRRASGACSSPKAARTDSRRARGCYKPRGTALAERLGGYGPAQLMLGIYASPAYPEGHVIVRGDAAGTPPPPPPDGTLYRHLPERTWIHRRVAVAESLPTRLTPSRGTAA